MMSYHWIGVSTTTLVHIIASNTTLIYDLVIDVVMTINEIDKCTTVRSLGQIQQKSTKKSRRKIHIPMVMNEIEGRINRLSTRDRARSNIT
jgi:hypothetical protein